MANLAGRQRRPEKGPDEWMEFIDLKGDLCRFDILGGHHWWGHHADRDDEIMFGLPGNRWVLVFAGLPTDHEDFPPVPPSRELSSPDAARWFYDHQLDVPEGLDSVHPVGKAGDGPAGRLRPDWCPEPGSEAADANAPRSPPEVVGMDSPGDEKLTACGRVAMRKQPSKEAFMAYCLYYGIGVKQEKQDAIRKILAKEFGHLRHQGTISRYIEKTKEFFEQGGLRPEDLKDRGLEAIPADPSA